MDVVIVTLVDRCHEASSLAISPSPCCFLTIFGLWRSDVDIWRNSAKTEVAVRVELDSSRDVWATVLSHQKQSRTLIRKEERRSRTDEASPGTPFVTGAMSTIVSMLQRSG